MSTPDDGYVWFEVAGIDPAHQRKLADVRDKVLAAWKTQEATNRLAAKAADLVRQIEGGADFAKIAAAQGVEVQHDARIKRSGDDNFPPNAIVVIFDVPTGGAGSASVPQGRLVFHVLDSVVPAYDPDTPEAKAIADQMRTAIGQDVLAQFVRKIETDAGVTINQAALRASTGGEQ